MTKKKLTMGLIVGNRGFFPDHLAKTSTVASVVHEATPRYLNWDMHWHETPKGAC
jgi:hypothetical protein